MHFGRQFFQQAGKTLTYLQIYLDAAALKRRIEVSRGIPAWLV